MGLARPSQYTVHDSPTETTTMKLTTALAAALAATALTAQAGGIVFQTAVTYTEPVTYAAGVTYLAPVTYAPSTPDARAAAMPVVLEGIVVTPKRTYGEREWHAHLAARGAAAQTYPVRSEKRYESTTPALLRVLLTK